MLSRYRGMGRRHPEGYRLWHCKSARVCCLVNWIRGQLAVSITNESAPVPMQRGRPDPNLGSGAANAQPLPQQIFCLLAPGVAADRARPTHVKLELNTVGRQVSDIQYESGKFRPTWHHAAAARGVWTPVAQPPTGRRVVVVAAWAARRRRQPGTRCPHNLVPVVLYQPTQRLTHAQGRCAIESTRRGSPTTNSHASLQAATMAW
jgi:hypothetical protein